jgi:acetylornithine deacetylase/succinyl-diaminopimelate desuccinylase-like protein
MSHHQTQQLASTATPDGLLLSMNVTSLYAGVRNDDTICLNIVPDHASATLDIRVPPTMSMHEAIDYIENIVKKYKNCTYTILAAVPDQHHEDSYKTPLYHSLAQTIQEYGLKPQPLFFEGSSDLRYYKALRIDGVGFTPFTTADAIHCTNESLPIADLIQGKNIMTQFLKNFCTKKGEYV